MGLFTSSAPQSSTPKISTDGTPIAPDRSQRSLCWEGRDNFFACLEKHNIVDSITNKEEADKFCSAESKAFDGVCARSWVTYFKKRRVMEAQKAETLRKLKAEGAEKMEGELPPGLKRA